MVLSKETKCELSGCEFDYSSNTYRLMVTLTRGNEGGKVVVVGENFLIVKVDGATGYPKILSIR